MSILPPEPLAAVELPADIATSPPDVLPLPPDIDTSPPVPDDTAPADIPTFPPTPAVPRPTDNAMEPDDPTLDPVDIVTEPEVPDDAVPVDISIEPLIPAVPPFDVLIFTSPLVLAPEIPLLMDTLPPVDDFDKPPDKDNVAPVELVPLLAPGLTVTSPASPDEESPLAIVTVPLLPDTVSPEAMFMAPLVLDPVLVPDDIVIEPLPLEPNALAPLVIVILPPVLLVDSPAIRSILDPSLMSLQPTDKIILPDCVVESPVSNFTSPDNAADPENISILPLVPVPTPDEISISPLLLELEPLAPLINEILPPVLLVE
jgi:hypothetical protein